MGIEWSLGEISQQTIDVPLTTMADYYRSRGFKVVAVELGYKHIGDFTSDVENVDAEFYTRYPNAHRTTRIGNSLKYKYVDQDIVDHLEIKINRINTNESDIL
jgi:hypothetical protein